MLSSMETQIGMTIIGPTGQALRIQRNHPAFTAIRNVVRELLPAEQQWGKLQELLENPLKALDEWCARFGIRFTDEETTFRLQDLQLSRAGWLTLLQRCHTMAASPEPVLLLAEKLGPVDAPQVAGLCLHLRDVPLRGKQVGVVRKIGLPSGARSGDLVDASSRGVTPFLVSYDKFYTDDSGAVITCEGMVLGPAPVAAVASDVLMQPAIVGHNRTYRCEEGTSDGWLEDLSFDSLKEAVGNARDIQRSGSEARIINRITGDVVAWS